MAMTHDPSSPLKKNKSNPINLYYPRNRTRTIKITDYEQDAFVY
ncbi:uncharacterized protein G2W53_006623 [Senna tora]|uniref:Uncharacterized protein n=1 Tax=Senna tora TaxID=362788 RepID=A0A835CE62_9FABA|nr:uncharacterized protein G2W53_006623 [Senna tora]